MVIMTGTLPKIFPQKAWSDHHLVSPREVFPTLVLLQEVPDQGSLGMPDYQSRPDLIREGEEVQFTSQLTVVPLLCLLAMLEVGLELGAVREAGPVDPLEHTVSLVPSPVGTCNAEETEGADHPRGGEVRPATEVCEAPLAVEGDFLLSDIIEEFNLIWFVPFPIEIEGFFPVLLDTLKRGVGPDNFGHPRFYPSQIFGSERTGGIKVVVKPIFDRWPDGELDPWKETLDRLCQNMGGAVTEDIATLLTLEDYRFEEAVLMHWGGEIPQLTIDSCGHGASGRRDDLFLKDGSGGSAGCHLDPVLVREGDGNGFHNRQGRSDRLPLRARGIPKCISYSESAERGLPGFPGRFILYL
jgi:hypothetical protein